MLEIFPREQDQGGHKSLKLDAMRLVGGYGNAGQGESKNKDVEKGGCVTKRANQHDSLDNPGELQRGSKDSSQYSGYRNSVK